MCQSWPNQRKFGKIFQYAVCPQSGRCRWHQEVQSVLGLKVLHHESNRCLPPGGGCSQAGHGTRSILASASARLSLGFFPGIIQTQILDWWIPWTCPSRLLCKGLMILKPGWSPVPLVWTTNGLKCTSRWPFNLMILICSVNSVTVFLGNSPQFFEFFVVI